MDSRTQTLIDVVSDAMVVADLSGRILGCNEAASRMFGYSRDEIMQLGRSELVCPGEQGERALTTRERDGVFRGVVTLVHKSGESFEAELTSVTVGAEEPEVWVVLRDLAERRSVETVAVALHESTELLRALVDAAFEGVLVHRDGVILRANGAAETAARVPPGGLIGRRLFDFIAPESRPLAAAKIASGSDEPYEAFGLRSDGTVYPLEVRVRQAPIQVGGAAARVVALRDITDRRALEDQFRQAQKMEAVGRLAGGIAHDFNNLLAVMLGATSLAVVRLPENHESRVDLADVQRAGERAAELTRQLLAFGRKQVVRPRVTALSTLLSDMQSMLQRTLATEHGHEIRLRVSCEEGCHLNVDPGQLELAILNLVVNARDALVKGGEIVVTGRRTGARIALSVSDDGIGIDAATRERVFEPFFTTKPPGAGTGLGLSSVFGIVHQAGGTIRVESELGRGSTFHIDFPATDAPLEAPPAVVAEAKGPAARTILVVEDEPSVRRIVRTLLERDGYRVLEAESGEEALGVARDHSGTIHLLLTDVIMAGMGGRELAEKLVSERPATRVVYMSGFVNEELFVRLGSRAAHIAKPFTPSALAQIVSAALVATAPEPTQR